MHWARRRATRNPNLDRFRAAMAAQQQLLNRSPVVADDLAISAFINSNLRSSADFFSVRAQ